MGKSKVEAPKRLSKAVKPYVQNIDFDGEGNIVVELHGKWALADIVYLEPATTRIVLKPHAPSDSVEHTGSD